MKLSTYSKSFKLKSIHRWLRNIFPKYSIVRLCIYVGIELLLLNSLTIWNHFHSWILTKDNIILAISILLIFIFLGIEIAIRCGNHHIKDIENVDNGIKPLIDDKPTTEDKIGIGDYVEIMGKKIISTFLNNKGSSFAINIEENYGYGKTSFLLILHQWFKEHYKGQVAWIDFKPWLCDNTKTLIIEFFHLLAKESDVDIDLHNDLIKYGNALASGILHINNLFNSSKNSLKSMHDTIAEKLQEKVHPIIITIDDLDRLDKDEILSVLKLIRDTADFPNIFYITAAEYTYLSEILKQCGITHPDRYLEKFFNLTLYLPAYEMNYGEQIQQNFKDYLKTELPNDKEIDLRNICEKNIVENIWNQCFTNIRDFKRFTNQLFLYLEEIRKTEYCLYDAVFVALLEYKCPEIYKILRDNDDILLGFSTSGNDHILCLKYDPEAEREQKAIIDSFSNKNKQKEEHIKSLSSQLNSKPFRNEVLGEKILNILFHQERKIYDYTIRRTNRFFCYFAGHNSKTSITKSEMINIVGLDKKSYKKELEKIFIEGRNKAFLHEFYYAVRKHENKVLDIISKFYVYLDYEHNQNISATSSDQSIELESLIFSLFNRRDSPVNQEAGGKGLDLTPLFREDNLTYNIMLLQLLKNDMNKYDFTKEQKESWMDILITRFIKERLESKDCISPENLYISEYFRRSTSIWDKKFLDYLESQKQILNYWLSNLIEQEKKNYEWNFQVKSAMFGDKFDDRSKTLIDNLSTSYPSLQKELNSLKDLLEKASLQSLDLSDNLFIKKFVR